LSQPSWPAGMQHMVAFRNIAVHEYTRLNLDIVLTIITKHLDDFRQFPSTIVKDLWLDILSLQAPGQFRLRDRRSLVSFKHFKLCEKFIASASGTWDTPFCNEQSVET
jgi:hypothetical protein